MMTEYNFDEDLEIDPDNLHIAWINQPGLMMKYAELQAQAKKRMELAHEKVKVTRSDLIKKIKLRNPSMTQQQVEASYRKSKEHKNAKKRQIKAEYEYNLLCGAVTAMSHKRTSLENLVRLHGQQYFAGPSMPKTIDKELIDRTKSKIAKNKIKRRRRK